MFGDAETVDLKEPQQRIVNAFGDGTPGNVDIQAAAIAIFEILNEMSNQDEIYQGRLSLNRSDLENAPIRIEQSLGQFIKGKYTTQHSDLSQARPIKKENGLGHTAKLNKIELTVAIRRDQKEPNKLEIRIAPDEPTEAQKRLQTPPPDVLNFEAYKALGYEMGWIPLN